MSHRGPHVGFSGYALLWPSTRWPYRRTLHVVSITDVEVSADFSYADIYVSALQNVEAAIKFLNNNNRPSAKNSVADCVLRLPLLRYHVDTRGNAAAELIDCLRGESGRKIRNRGNMMQKNQRIFSVVYLL